MAVFTQHTETTAPKSSAGVLADIKSRYGFIPNLAAFLAESPVALGAVLSLSEAFDKTSLSPREQQVVLLTASVSNDCNYCRTAHTGLGLKAGLDSRIVDATLEAGPIEDPKLGALRELTAALVEHRGRIEAHTLDAFLAAGYTHAQVFEVVLGVTLKTLTNYSNHLAGAEPNPEFSAMVCAR